MHEILIYSFTLCLPNGLVTKEPRVGGGGLSTSTHLDAHLGIWGELIPLFGSYSVAPLERRPCVRWGRGAAVGNT